MNRRLFATAALILTGVAAALVPATAAHAAVGCYAGTCTGKDPSAQGCGADATTIDSRTEGTDLLELRFSRACWAAWVRFTSASYTFTGIVEGYSSPCAPEQYPTCWAAAREAAPFGDSIHRTGRYSDMVSYTYWVRVCE